MIVKSPNKLPERKRDWYVFLAGPIQDAPDWQNTIENIEGVTFLSPRRESYENFNWDEQVKWETVGLRICDVVLFWIPPYLTKPETRDYAQTTRTEFGEMIGRGKKIIFGCHNDFPGRRYFVEKCENYGIIPHDNLEDCIQELRDYIVMKKPGIYFTSDTHFSSQRTFELSKRPFRSVEDMDWTMIEKWNQKVTPGSTVYHLGDFGETWPLQYLNGNIELVLGNYEREAGVDYMNSLLELFDKVKQDDVVEGMFLYHEPIEGNKRREDSGCKYLLFGHIHGRQKIKEFGIDVGIDGNNYVPYSIEDINFYLNAIDKGYYDSEVFC